jgi:hypothetical protein
MKSVPFGILCSAAAMSIAAPAMAASADYYLIIDGVDGEASSAIEVQSWSWGASNPSTVGAAGQGRVVSPRDPASGQATGRGVVTSASPGTTGGVNVAAGDLDGDGRADLVALEKLNEVSGFTLTLAPGTGARSACAAGKHIAHAHLLAKGVVYDFEDVVVSSCTGGSTLGLTGRMKDYHGGHVTLMK